MLMMVLCDREGKVYDVWITFGSMHEVRAFRERKKRSVWFRGLAEMVRVGVSLGARRETFYGLSGVGAKGKRLHEKAIRLYEIP